MISKYDSITSVQTMDLVHHYAPIHFRYQTVFITET